jgi:hypothetical protein
MLAHGIDVLWAPTCSRIEEEYWWASASRNSRVNRAATLGFVSDLRLLDLPSTPCSRVFHGCLNQLDRDLSPHNDRWFHTSTSFRPPNTENQNVQRTPASQSATAVKIGKTCFNYWMPGHFALRCPDRRWQSTPTQGTTALPNHNGSSTPTQAQ